MKKEQEKFKKEEYQKKKKKIDLMIALAILCILLGITGVVFGAEFFEESQMHLPITWFGALLGIAIILILMIGFQNQNYRKRFPQIPECYEKSEKKEVQKKRNQALIVGGVVLAIGILLVVGCYWFELVEKLSLLPIAILFLALSYILPQIAYWKLEEEKMDIKKYNRQGKEEKRRAILFGSGIVITIVLTGIGTLLFHNWDISFSIFFFGSILSIMLSSIVGKEKKDKGESYEKDARYRSNQGGENTDSNS